MNRVIQTLGLSICPILCWTAKPAAGQERAIVSPQIADWNNLQMLDSTWQSEQQAYRNRPFDKFDKTWISTTGMLADVIAGNVPHDYQYPLMLEVTRRHPRLAARPEFLQAMGEAFATLFAGRSDRGALVTVLSRRCPKSLDSIPIDVWLATRQFEAPSVPPKGQTGTSGGYNPSAGLPNGILVLCDAFEQSDDDEVRAVIAKALRHAFRPHLAEAVDDSQFVIACRGWYHARHAEFYASIGNWYPGAFSPVGGPPPQLFRSKSELK